MPLEPIGRLLENAQRHQYALGFFESWNLESLQGVIDAAEKTRSPIIIGFNGEFLSQRAGASADELALYGAMGVAAAQARVPCGFIFNECSNDAWVERAITEGFNLVMPCDSTATPAEYTRRVKRLTGLAHARGVAVEADAEDENEDDPASYAMSAEIFAHETGVDLLAVSVGNEEIKLHGRVPLDLARLEAIHWRIDIPLALHGGSGIEDDSLKAAIRLGVRKVNYGTYIKQRYLQAIRSALSIDEQNPHALLGDGSETDVVVIGRKAVREAVLERIELLGCCGRAA